MEKFFLPRNKLSIWLTSSLVVATGVAVVLSVRTKKMAHQASALLGLGEKQDLPLNRFDREASDQSVSEILN